MAPQEGYDTRKHHHRWRQNAELSPRKIFAHTRYLESPSGFEPGLYKAIWDKPVHHEVNSRNSRCLLVAILMTKEKVITSATLLTEEAPAQSNSWGRHPGIQHLAQETLLIPQQHVPQNS
jgi:hypothetical protein